MQHRRESHGRFGRLIPAMIGAVSVLLAGCSGDAAPSSDTRTVEVLWFGVQPDGSILGGTLESSIDLREGEGGVGIDVEGITASGAGETWAASAWTAAVTALIFYGGVPDGLELAIEVADAIDGPSAGGLISLAALADLSGVNLRPGVSMTGTIYPNGAIGPVGGIPEKLRGAAAAGLTTVVVPESKRTAVDPRTGDEVDVARFAAELGIEVVFVGSLNDARAVLFDEESITEEPLAALDDDRLRELFADRAAALAVRLGALEVAAAPVADIADEAERTERRLALERTAFDGDVDAEDFFVGYFVAADTERSVLAWNAAVEVIDLAVTDSSDAAIDDLRRSAEDLISVATDTTVRTASTDVDSIEQLIALVDVTEWSTDALEVASSIANRIETRPSMDLLQIGALAADLAGQRYHLDHTVADVLDVALAYGSTPLRSATLDELEVFIEVLAAAVDANQALLELKLRTEGVMLDTAVVEGLVGVDEVVADALDRAETETARRIIVLADEISRYVMTSKLLNLDRSAMSTDALVQRLNLLDPDKLAAQVDLAVETSDAALATLVGRGVDPGYFLWEANWAAGVARGDEDRVITADEQLDALSRLWFANINERILVALTRPVTD